MITLLKLRPYPGDMVVPSPNHGARRAPVIQGIVLHATEDEGNEAHSLTWLRSPKSRASCHLLVSRSGRVTRLVGDQQRAWHAGQASWRGTSDVNSVTLGIEIANRNDGEPFTDAQYSRVADIVAHYCRQGLSLDDVVSHGEIAAPRRTDPFGWDWNRFRGMVRYRLRDGAAKSRRTAPTRAARAAEKETPRAPTAATAARPVTPPGPRARAADASKPAPKTPKTPKSTRRGRRPWLNGATVLASGGILAADMLDLAHRIGMTMPEHFSRWALFAVGLLSILLRLRSTFPPDTSEGDDRVPSGVHS